ncbi:MAG: Gfo/Idh/MocA family oxidoreductase [Alphaproteobacteria bacterium]|nr:Gfo/Idh/MocA family oxidoreductase [Alphaproteobacteria bacterium]
MVMTYHAKNSMSQEAKMKQLRVAVIGVGQMGVNHLKTYQKRDDISIVGIVDVDRTRAQNIAAEYNCRSLKLEDLPGHIDAVSIVTDSQTHFKIAGFFLSKGIHCLVEKPLAMNLEQSKQLVDSARASNAVLLVGHIEEYNSGFQFLRESLERNGETPQYIACERFNYGSDRITDADVVLDLMIHDLGCVIDLLGPEVRHLEVLSSHGAGNAQSVDVAVANLRTKDCMINLQANRISHQSHREFSLHTKNFSYFLNFMSQQVSVFHKGQLTSQTSHPWVYPLESEVGHFIECIRDPKKQPLTSGIKASVALKYVEHVQRRIYKKTEDKAL